LRGKGNDHIATTNESKRAPFGRMWLGSRDSTLIVKLR